MPIRIALGIAMSLPRIAIWALAGKSTSHQEQMDPLAGGLAILRCPNWQNVRVERPQVLRLGFHDLWWTVSARMSENVQYIA